MAGEMDSAHANPDTDAHAYRDGNPDPDFDGHADCDRHTDCDRHPDGIADVHGHNACDRYRIALASEEDTYRQRHAEALDARCDSLDDTRGSGGNGDRESGSDAGRDHEGDHYRYACEISNPGDPSCG